MGMATEAPSPVYARPSLERAHADPAERQFRRRLRLYQELMVRGGVALLIVAFQLAFPVEPAAFSRCIWLLALFGLFLNGPYFLAARNGQAFVAQAYIRILVDVALLSLGLYFAGGLAAAHFLGVYLIVMIYAGITFSSRACLTATAAATGSYIAIVVLQHAGILSAPFELPNAAMIATFNLILLNVAGGLTAVLSRALRDSRRRLRATYQELERFVEAIPDVIYVLDRAGRLTLWNQKLETVTGRGADGLRGELLADFLSGDDRAAFRAALAAGLDNRPFEIESRLRAADGGLIAYQWTGAALIDEQGQVSGLTGVGRDVTERKRADDILRRREAEMRQLQKIEAIGRLAGGVAHDFNNALTVVIGRCQLMLSRFQPDDPVYQDLDQIEITAQRAASLTRQLLAFSRNQASARQPVDLNATVTSVSDMLARLIGENIELAVMLDPKLDLVTADPGQLEQVIVNFAVNARDAMPNGGRLTITTKNVMLTPAFVAAHPAASVGPHVVVEVSDTGIGMDEPTLQRAFEPFFTTKAPGKGCGLGLSTVYGIVNGHGGYTEVESESGYGSTFRVYIPRIEAPVTAPRTETARDSLPGGDATILLVEDEAAVRRLVGEILSRLGYRVLVASDGIEALALSREFAEPIQLLLTDVIMPGMDGRELAERMMITRPDTRILFMSGYAEPPIPDEVLLQKPLTPDALARKVAAILRQPILAR